MLGSERTGAAVLGHLGAFIFQCIRPRRFRTGQTGAGQCGGPACDSRPRGEDTSQCPCHVGSLAFTFGRGLPSEAWEGPEHRGTEQTLLPSLEGVFRVDEEGILGLYNSARKDRVLRIQT